MRVAELLGKLEDDRVRAIARDRIAEAGDMSTGKLVAELESTIRTIAYLQRVLIARLPPTFSLLLCLTESDGFTLQGQDLMALAKEHCESLVTELTTGTFLAESDDRLYRRVLAEAWRTNLALDTSEVGLLGVLRHELGLSLVDHYITCYHADLYSYWRTGDAFSRELAALHKAGILFSISGLIVLPEDLVCQVRQALGIYMPRDMYRRLMSWIPNPELAEALRNSNMPVSGSKSARIERLVSRMIPPANVLQLVGIAQLQEIAAGVGCVKSGAKDSLIERLIEYFREGLDQSTPTEVQAELEVEQKLLGDEAFASLFESLTGKELAQILEKMPELPQSGSKAIRIATLWNSRYSEISLLSELTNRQLADILVRHDLNVGGSKGDRTRRIVDAFIEVKPVGEIQPSRPN